MWTSNNNVDGQRWETNCQQQGLDGWFGITYNYIDFNKGPFTATPPNVHGDCL